MERIIQATVPWDAWKEDRTQNISLQEAMDSLIEVGYWIDNVVILSYYTKAGTTTSYPNKAIITVSK